MSSSRLQFRIPGRPVCIGAVRRFFRRFLGSCPAQPFDEREVGRLELALHECLTNAAQYGGEEADAGPIEVEVRMDADRLVMKVRDRGRGFDPDAVPAPVPEELREGGYGLFIIQETMDHVAVARSEDGFEMSMVRLFPGTERAGAGRRP